MLFHIPDLLKQQDSVIVFKEPALAQGNYLIIFTNQTAEPDHFISPCMHQSGFPSRLMEERNALA